MNKMYRYKRLNSWNDKLSNAFKDKTIVSMHMTDNRVGFRIDFDDGSHVYGETEGDCCSYSWMEYLDLVDFPAKVLSGPYDSEPVENPAGESEEEHECKQFYATMIDTDKGTIRIEFRNESNGYYGGWINWMYEEADPNEAN